MLSGRGGKRLWNETVDVMEREGGRNNRFVRAAAEREREREREKFL